MVVVSLHDIVDWYIVSCACGPLAHCTGCIHKRPHPSSTKVIVRVVRVIACMVEIVDSPSPCACAWPCGLRFAICDIARELYSRARPHLVFSSRRKKTTLRSVWSLFRSKAKNSVSRRMESTGSAWQRRTRNGSGIQLWLRRSTVVRCSSRQEKGRGSHSKDGLNTRAEFGGSSGIILSSSPLLVLTSASILEGFAQEDELVWRDFTSESGSQMSVSDVRSSLRLLRLEILNPEQDDQQAGNAGDWLQGSPLWGLRSHSHFTALSKVLASLPRKEILGGDFEEQPDGQTASWNDVAGELALTMSQFLVLQMRPSPSNPRNVDARSQEQLTWVTVCAQRLFEFSSRAEATLLISRYSSYWLIALRADSSLLPDGELPLLHQAALTQIQKVTTRAETNMSDIR